MIYDGMSYAQAYVKTMDEYDQPIVLDESDECVYRSTDRCKWESVKALLDRFVLGDADIFLGEVVRPVSDHDAVVVIELGTDTISCYCSLADTYFEVDEIISRNYRVLVETYQKLMKNKNEAGN